VYICVCVSVCVCVCVCKLQHCVYIYTVRPQLRKSQFASVALIIVLTSALGTGCTVHTQKWVFYVKDIVRERGGGSGRGRR